MKGYDTLQEQGAVPNAPPPYSPYNQSPPHNAPAHQVINVAPHREQPNYYPQSAVHMMQPAHNVNTNVRVAGQSQGCCCCCCTCPFWVCCLMILLLIAIPLIPVIVIHG